MIRIFITSRLNIDMAVVILFIIGCVAAILIPLTTNSENCESIAGPLGIVSEPNQDSVFAFYSLKRINLEMDAPGSLDGKKRFSRLLYENPDTLRKEINVWVTVIYHEPKGPHSSQPVLLIQRAEEVPDFNPTESYYRNHCPPRYRLELVFRSSKKDVSSQAVREAIREQLNSKLPIIYDWNSYGRENIINKEIPFERKLKIVGGNSPNKKALSSNGGKALIFPFLNVLAEAVVEEFVPELGVLEQPGDQVGAVDKIAIADDFESKIVRV